MAGDDTGDEGFKDGDGNNPSLIKSGKILVVMVTSMMNWYNVIKAVRRLLRTRFDRCSISCVCV